MEAITKNQARIVGFIEDFIKVNQYSPTFNEIASGCGLKSLATVSKHVGNLKAKGVLTGDRNRSRSLDVAKPENRFVFHVERLWDTVEKCYWVREK